MPTSQAEPRRAGRLLILTAALLGLCLAALVFGLWARSRKPAAQREVLRCGALTLTNQDLAYYYWSEYYFLVNEGGSSLDPDTERVAPIGNDIIEQRTDDVGQHDEAHDDEKRLVLQAGQERVDRLAGDDRIGQVDQRDKQCADHIEEEQPPMRLKKRKEDRKHSFLLIVFGCHAKFSNFFLVICS